MRKTEVTTAIESLVAEWQPAKRLPSLVAGVSVGGELVCSAAVGTADANQDSPIAVATQYRIGSVTKTFTASLVVSLAAEGVFCLGDRVGEHIDGTRLERVTIAQLLSHSGGVQREPVTPMWQTFVGPTEQELAESLPSSELVAEPGAGWHYSNLGYAILGQIVGQTTGEIWEKLF